MRIKLIVLALVATACFGQATIWQSGIFWRQAAPASLPTWCTPAGVGTGNVCEYLNATDGLRHLVYTAGDTANPAIGPPGPMGPAGPAGAVGLQGPAGPAGPNGATGATGVTGAQGLQGPIGPAGPPGAVGLQGPAGPAGQTGATGAAGAQGTQG